MLGCEGRTTTDIVPWRCNDSSNQCPMTAQPAGLAGFWRFDEGQLGGDWHGDAPAPRWVDCGEQGGEWATDSWSGVCGSERLGGTGASLRLAGQGYVAAPLPDPLANGPVTLSAWISLPRPSDIPRSSVLAVVRPACQSVYLDVLTDTAGTNRS
ncbi:MAG TPA: hypothetical protein VFU02_22405 [Polyangiaceae bacterium]|nr:hypothetical protein [Polyangiaceae bacterium]